MMCYHGASRKTRQRSSLSITQCVCSIFISFWFACFVSSWSITSFVSLRRTLKQINSRHVQFSPLLSGNSTYIHNYFMNLAVEEAKKAGRKGEVPIGALIVEHKDEENYHILSCGYNMVEMTNDATAHAEVIALRRASKKIRNWRLFNKTLYSTMEPCPICLSSAQAFRIHTIVYGAPQLRLGAIESHMRLLDDYTHPFHTIDEVIPGVMEKECSELLKNFFRQKRKEKPRVPMSEYMTVKKPFLSRLRRRKKEL